MPLSEKVQKLLDSARADEKTKELLTEFFESIQDDRQYDKIIELFERFPGLYDNFVLCFKLKRDYFKKGGSEKDWNNIIAKEEEALNQLKIRE